MGLYTVLKNGVPYYTGQTVTYVNAPVQSDTNVTLTSSGAAFSLYNLGTSTSAASAERVVIDWASNIGEIGTEKIGTGSSRNMRVKSAANILFTPGSGNDSWVVLGNNHFKPGTSNAYDIGDSTQAVRDIYVQGVVTFNNAASTFAQTATITNGPRAANPVAWVEVRYGATGAQSTGRIPIW